MGLAWLGGYKPFNKREYFDSPQVGHYYTAPMLAQRIDSGVLQELAEQRASGEFRLGPDQLPRLRALLAQGAEPGVALQVKLSVDQEGQAQVELHIAGNLPLICQRCLAPMVWPLGLDARLTVLRDEAAAELLADPFDSVVLEEGCLDLVKVAEDEILAALPMAPLHEDGTACAGKARVADDKLVVNKPFAELASLMGVRTGAGNTD